MLFRHIRLRNRILQAFYRPQSSKNGLIALPSKSLSLFGEIEKGIEKKITPLLSELFD